MADNAVQSSGRAPQDRVFDIDFYNMPGVEEDYHQAWKTLQDKSAPYGVIWTPQNGGHWIAVRAQSIQDVLSDYRRFSSYRMTIPPGVDRSGRWDVLPISLDPPTHQPYRNLLNAGLSPRAVKERADRIRGLCVSLIERVAPHRACEFVADYAEEFPIQMLFTIMDIPIDEKPHLMRVIHALTSPDGSMSVEEIVAEFSDFLRPYIQKRIKNPGTDLISQICNGKINGRPISEKESVQMCVQAFAAGLESVRNGLSFIVGHLARDQKTQQALRSDTGLISDSINEFMRRFAAMVMAREVVQDMDYDGVHLHKGDLIACPAQLAGLDERENECPMRLDLHRSKIVSVAFGAGAHICAGRWLAEFEIRVTLEEWLSRTSPFRIRDGAKISYSGGILGSVKELPLVW